MKREFGKTKFESIFMLMPSLLIQFYKLLIKYYSVGDIENVSRIWE